MNLSSPWFLPVYDKQFILWFRFWTESESFDFERPKITQLLFSKLKWTTCRYFNIEAFLCNIRPGFMSCILGCHRRWNWGNWSNRGTSEWTSWTSAQICYLFLQVRKLNMFPWWVVMKKFLEVYTASKSRPWNKPNTQLWPVRFLSSQPISGPDLFGQGIQPIKAGITVSQFRSLYLVVIFYEIWDSEWLNKIFRKNISYIS